MDYDSATIIKNCKVTIDILNIDDGKIEIQEAIGALIFYLQDGQVPSATKLSLEAITSTISVRKNLISKYIDSNILNFLSTQLSSGDDEVKRLVCVLLRLIIKEEDDTVNRYKHLSHICASSIPDLLIASSGSDNSYVQFHALFAISNLINHSSPQYVRSLISNPSIFRVMGNILDSKTGKNTFDELDTIVIVKVLTIISLLLKAPENSDAFGIVKDMGLLFKIFGLLTIDNPIILEYTIAVFINITCYADTSIKEELINFGILLSIATAIQRFSYSTNSSNLNILLNCAKVLSNLTNFPIAEVKNPENVNSMDVLFNNREIIVNSFELVKTRDYNIQLCALKTLVNLLNLSSTANIVKDFKDYNILPEIKKIYSRMLKDNSTDEREFMYSHSSMKDDIKNQVLNILGLLCLYDDALINMKSEIVNEGFIALLIDELKEQQVSNESKLTLKVLECLFCLSSNNFSAQQEISIHKEKVLEICNDAPPSSVSRVQELVCGIF
ncbi:hypothetical protein DASC09_002110 [Saccharomycopsis crataegensis]|uniref:Uncharacterized protein n=1 Tax=Saccharomycopsis crataegensis TaxID=43959 RepID=A0AAV5QDR4_9ASCO|nr:hypothetical protein DASC09_002110 [Saccharomycopsis crataegensis]